MTAANVLIRDTSSSIAAEVVVNVISLVQSLKSAVRSMAPFVATCSSIDALYTKFAAEAKRPTVSARYAQDWDGSQSASDLEIYLKSLPNWKAIAGVDRSRAL